MDYKKKSTKQVSSYFLIEEIGKGASAKVYLSVDERKDELVAIKTIPVENLKKDNGLINLKRELQILHKLKHDNIVKIKDFQSTKRNNYVVMEYCNGGNLFEYKRFYEKVTKSTLNEFFIQKIIRQITDGLQYMHSQNIVHRDIKLENILLNFNKYPNYAIKGNMPPKVRYEDVTLNDSFTIKIADLGYSKELNESMGSTILGTPMHMSPDIIGNYVGTETKKYNTSVDLWSLGTITYQLLTGKYPFIGKGHEEIFKHVMEGKYSLPSSLTVSVELITFINGLLQFYPEKRLNWEQIKSHPFLTKNIENFNYIELKGLEENDKKVIEMNAKDCDNLLWVLFKSKGLNMNLDKLNMNEIKNKQMKQNIKENVVNNEEIKKAIEAEKKKIEEEKKRLLKEKKEAEKLKKEAEELKKEVNLIQQKNEKEKEKINEEEKKRKELEEKNKKLEAEKINNNNQNININNNIQNINNQNINNNLNNEQSQNKFVRNISSVREEEKKENNNDKSKDIFGDLNIKPEKSINNIPLFTSNKNNGNNLEEQNKNNDDLTNLFKTSNNIKSANNIFSTGQANQKNIFAFGNLNTQDQNKNEKRNDNNTNQNIFNINNNDNINQNNNVFNINNKDNNNNQNVMQQNNQNKNNIFPSFPKNIFGNDNNNKPNNIFGQIGYGQHRNIGENNNNNNVNKNNNPISYSFGNIQNNQNNNNKASPFTGLSAAGGLFQNNNANSNQNQDSYF